jgi:hypothetical protein
MVEIAGGAIIAANIAVGDALPPLPRSRGSGARDAIDDFHDGPSLGTLRGANHELDFTIHNV